MVESLKTLHLYAKKLPLRSQGSFCFETNNYTTMKPPPPLPEDSDDDGTCLVGCLILLWTFVIGILVGVLLKS